MPILRPRVHTAADAAPALVMPGSTGAAAVAAVTEDAYLLKLTKYIPAEIVVAYQFVSGILVGWESPWSPWLSLGWVAFLAILTPAWIRYATSDPAHGAHRFQMYSALVAFLLWVFTLGGSWLKLLPAQFVHDQPIIGSVVLVAATLLIPFLEKIFSQPPAIELR